MAKVQSSDLIIALISLLPSFPVSGRSIDKKLQLANLASFALSPGKPPYKIAVYVPGTKVRLCDHIVYALGWQLFAGAFFYDFALKHTTICKY